MTYSYIPNPTDNLSKSQSDIKNNFTTADSVMGVNHFPFTDGTANKGKHKFVEMPNSASVPGGLAATEGTFYSKTSVTGSNAFYTDDVSGLEWQLTRVVDANIATFGISNNGWTFLPGGLLMKYGLFLAVPSTLTTYTPPGPAFTTPPSVVVLTVSSSSSTDLFAQWNNATTTTVDVRVNTGNRSVSYVIIGR